MRSGHFIHMISPRTIFRAPSLIPRPHDGEYTPINNHLFDVMMAYLSRILPTENEFKDAFNIFEFLHALLFAFEREEWKSDRIVFDGARFGWCDEAVSTIKDFFREGMREENWSVRDVLLKAHPDTFKNFCIAFQNHFYRVTAHMGTKPLRFEEFFPS